MKYPKTLLLFIGQAHIPSEPLVIPSLGIHALSAYLRERKVPAKAIQVYCPVKRSIADRLLNRIGASSESIRCFKENPEQQLAEAASSKDEQNLRMLIKLWIAMLVKESPDVVGFSIYNSNFSISLLLASMIKKTQPETLIIFGGPEVREPTIPILLRSGFVDVLVEGEGEETLFQVIRKRAMDKLPLVPGSIVMQGEKIQSTGLKAEVLNMDELPPPDFDDLFRHDVESDMLPVEFNRGCVAKCDFCAERKFWDHYRQMSVEKAVDRIETMKERYQRDKFFLSQSLMNGDMAWLTAFAEELIVRNSAVLWGGNARIHPKMDHAFVDLLYRAGCRFFHFGLESGSQLVLKKMKKGVRLGSVSDVLSASNKVGMWNHTYWIFGYPGETVEQLLLTIDFILENNHLIHSHRYHHYIDVDSLGKQSDSIYGYAKERCEPTIHGAPYYRELQPFFNRLFDMEVSLLFRLHGPIHAAATPRDESDHAAAHAVKQQWAREREFTLRIARAYIIHHDLREDIANGLTEEKFDDIFSEYADINSADPFVTDPESFVNGLMARLRD